MAKADHTPIEVLIERWRVAPATRWDEIVGHERAIRRLRELVALVELPPAERERLGLRLGAGVVISGPPGTGKTLAARAFAAALGRPIVVPPPGELTPARIAALYAALAAGEPAIVLLDEAEGLLGSIGGHDELGVDPDCQRSLLAALDGVARPEAGPITVALTTLSIDALEPAAIRPGRLAPRLVLEPPSEAERAELLRRAVDELPGADGLDLARVAARMDGWSGAAIVEAVRAAMLRSLVPGPPGLRTELLLEVAADDFTEGDPVERDALDIETVARHESSHALFSTLAWGSDPETGAAAVSRIRVHDHGGETELAAWVRRRAATREELRRKAGFSLAGAVGERLTAGRDGATTGGGKDRGFATHELLALRAIELPFDEAALHGSFPDLAAEAMKAARYEAIRVLADEVWSEVHDALEPYRTSITTLATVLLAAPERTLSGPELEDALAIALGQGRA